MFVADRKISRLSLSLTFHSCMNESMRLKVGTISSGTFPATASLRNLLKITNRPQGFSSTLYKWNKLQVPREKAWGQRTVMPSRKAMQCKSSISKISAVQCQHYKGWEHTNVFRRNEKYAAVHADLKPLFLMVPGKIWWSCPALYSKHVSSVTYSQKQVVERRHTFWFDWLASQ